MRVTLKHKISNDHDLSDFLILDSNSEEDESLIVHSILFRGAEANTAIGDCAGSIAVCTDSYSIQMHSASLISRKLSLIT